MKIAIITLGDINGGSKNLPDRNIIKEAQKNMCMSAAFWARIKNGKYPYVFKKEEDSLVEASYNDTIAALKKEKSGSVSLNEKEVYWLTDSEFPDANAALKKISNIDKLKQSYKDKLKDFTD